jgi:hypothetical protein
MPSRFLRKPPNGNFQPMKVSLLPKKSRPGNFWKGVYLASAAGGER